MLDPFQFFYHPKPEPDPDEDAEQRYRDMVVVVRDGIPVRKLAAIGIDPELLIARMLADGVIGPDLKPLHPIIDKWEEIEALEGAEIRLFASQTPANVAKAEPVISAEEAERRRTHVRGAIANSRIAGYLPPSRAEQAILDAYVRGEIEAEDLVEVIKRMQQYGALKDGLK